MVFVDMENLRTIYYKQGYKYQLTGTHVFYIDPINDHLYPPDAVDLLDEPYWEISPFLSVYPSGKVVQHYGYAWDGASGPAIDGPNNTVPALEHDGGYQILRAGLLPVEPWRKKMDRRLFDGVRERGMNWFRAWYWYRSVRKFGLNSATNKRILQSAE